jgi:ketosteroid isomerase-like protein
MTIVHDTSQPEQLPAAFVAAFNAADPRAIGQIYEDGAVLAPQPGRPVTGPGLLAAHEHLLRLGLPMDATIRHTYVAGDIALLVVDWSIAGTTIADTTIDGTIAGMATDGREVRIAGTATDVARRGADGRWRYVIDNPFGSS